MGNPYLPDTELLRSLREVDRQFKLHRVPLEHDISFFLEAFTPFTEKLSLSEGRIGALVKECCKLRDPDMVAAMIIRAVAEDPANAGLFSNTKDLENIYLRSGVEQSLHTLGGRKICWDSTLTPPHAPEPPPVEPGPVKKALSFTERYFLNPGKLDVIGEFRAADTKRLCFKTGLSAVGALAMFDAAGLALQKDEEGKTHPYEALMVGGAGAASLAAGLLMRGKPLSI